MTDTLLCHSVQASFTDFVLFFLFHHETRTKVIVHFLCKREWQDKDGEARDVSLISQPPEPQEPICDSLDDVSCFEVSISQFDPGHF